MAAATSWVLECWKGASQGRLLDSSSCTSCNPPECVAAASLRICVAS